MRETILNSKESELTNEKVNALIDFTIHTNDLLLDINNETTKALGSVLESLKGIFDRLDSAEKFIEYSDKMIEIQNNNIEGSYDLITEISKRFDIINERIDLLIELNELQ